MPLPIIPLTCQFCGQALNKRSQVKFCSKQCAALHKNKLISEEVKGQRFEALVAISYVNNAQWKFKCDCGKTFITRLRSVKSGHAKSCGCRAWDNAHNRSKTAEYRVWDGMKDRCLRPANIGFKRYGGRGITICDRWLHSFENFLADMGHRPSPLHSIERKNNNGNYEPDNCIWALPKEQQRNTRVNHNVTFNDRTMCLAAWAEELGITPMAMRYRLKMWPLADALSKPKRDW